MEFTGESGWHGLFGIVAPQDGDTIAVDGGQLLPYIAIERIVNEYDIVYVLFAARENATSGDLDLYLCGAWTTAPHSTTPTSCT